MIRGKHRKAHEHSGHGSKPGSHAGGHKAKHHDGVKSSHGGRKPRKISNKAMGKRLRGLEGRLEGKQL